MASAFLGISELVLVGRALTKSFRQPNQVLLTCGGRVRSLPANAAALVGFYAWFGRCTCLLRPYGIVADVIGASLSEPHMIMSTGKKVLSWMDDDDRRRRRLKRVR